MKAKSMKRYRTPGYPTKLQILARRELLERHWPETWRMNARVAGAAALLVAAGGCQKRADIACVVVTPPVFLSEEEAVQVIAEELRQADVSISQTNVALDRLTVRHDFEWPGQTRGLSGAPGSKVGTRGLVDRDSPGVVMPLEVDGWSEESDVAFEYVSTSDCFEYGEVRSTAQFLNEQVAESGEDIYFRAFHDPLSRITTVGAEGADPRERREQAILAAQEESKRLLREQVTDFVNWLKAQGAI